MTQSPHVRIIALLAAEGATIDEIFAYLTDRRRGAGLTRSEAVMYLEVFELAPPTGEATTLSLVLPGVPAGPDG